MVSATSKHPAQPHEYSDEERRRLFAAFQAELAQHRGQLKKLYVWIAVAIASFALLLPTQHSFVGLFPGIALVVSVAFLVHQLVRTIDRLVCPGCGERQLYSLGQFCPQCGSTEIEPPKRLFDWPRITLIESAERFPTLPHCGSCGAVLAFGKRIPIFRRRFCASCGQKLDDEGF
jgi:predicted RNA-binding Zn-ribbon protein involved in translation (DUF1610 family)